MSTQRMIRTRFWSDSWIETQSPTAKLLFLFLLTNPKTNLCGIYEISLKTIAFESGLEDENISALLKGFEEAGKVYYYEGFVILRNSIKHQQTSNPKILQGIRRELKQLPQRMKDFLLKIETDSLSIDNDNLSYSTLLNLTSLNSTEQSDYTYTLEKVLATAELANIPAKTAEDFFHYYNRVGWFINKQPIVNLLSALLTWKSNELKFNPGGNPEDAEHKRRMQL